MCYSCHVPEHMHGKHCLHLSSFAATCEVYRQLVDHQANAHDASQVVLCEVFAAMAAACGVVVTASCSKRYN